MSMNLFSRLADIWRGNKAGISMVGGYTPYDVTGDQARYFDTIDTCNRCSEVGPCAMACSENENESIWSCADCIDALRAKEKT